MKFLLLWLGLGLLNLGLTTYAMAQETLPSQTATQHAPYNLVLGTQTIGASYGFTRETRLVETARRILEMGSTTLKFSLPTEKTDAFTPRQLVDVARSNPSVKTVLSLPFMHILMWAYPVVSQGEPTDAKNLDANYREIYDLTRYLLTTFADTRKTFYLGNWEGDWHLLHTKPEYTPTDIEIKNMIAWVNIRQKAVDDAKRATPHQGVEVFYYLEVNRVQDAMAGKLRLTNAVLPHTAVDFVSYSSYDSLSDPDTQLPAALNFIEAKLAPKAGISGKRVWIGEYGFPAAQNTPAQQDEKTRRVMRIGLEWGCPFVLYWEFYNNEVEAGQQRGFWLINDKNEKTPVYFTHQRFLAQARKFTADYERTNGQTPSRAAFNAAAKSWLTDPVPTLPNKP